MTDTVGTNGWSGDEADLEGRQGAKLYPVGKALRATYDADNHATLGKDVTVLMLDLAQVPFEPHEFEPILPPLRPPPRPGWLARMRLAIRRSRRAGG
ncbi:hypothetical protein M9979_09140 [Sphingomonas sp. RP10(2022)]|uniref:Uncharacterized protein n=1 Tax=Sphingomonas liriopis TaxID=2949094 RepID=A0A9X2HRB0_9SPHN|nr:hypothetical protein [Sphingomonas liriopis]MCP3735032.1 hypothetical protein [Sphingomonas liriopis]